MNMATRARKKLAGTARVTAAAGAAREQLLDTVHQVWLAGLGAMSKTQKGAPKLFEELVEEGARVHATTTKAAGKKMRSLVSSAQGAFQDQVSGARARASETLGNFEKIFQTRVQRTLHQMGVPGSRDIERLSARVEALNTNIEKLARRRTPAARAGNGKRVASHTPAAH
jgi:poly(hydroxyalkanoate) granule-associated protein